MPNGHCIGALEMLQQNLKSSHKYPYQGENASVPLRCPSPFQLYISNWSISRAQSNDQGTWRASATVVSGQQQSTSL